MKQASFFVGTMAALVLLVNEAAAATTMDQLIAAAKKEGELELLAPSTLGPQGAQALGAGFNKKYGVNVTVRYSPSNNMVADVAKLVTQSAAGAPPEWTSWWSRTRTTRRSG
jgi:tripartite-type tricarboxylate transporter receptor subunit TctC